MDVGGARLERRKCEENTTQAKERSEMVLSQGSSREHSEQVYTRYSTFR